MSSMRVASWVERAEKKQLQVTIDQQISGHPWRHILSFELQ